MGQRLSDTSPFRRYCCRSWRTCPRGKTDLEADVTEQQEILELAASLATRCGDAYRKANDRTRKLFNAAVFERLEVKGGRLCHEQYRPPFDGVFTVSEFEYETRVEVAGIEPASSSFLMSLLRAQLAEDCRDRDHRRRQSRSVTDEHVPGGLSVRPVR